MRLRTSLSPEALGAGLVTAYRGVILFFRLIGNTLRVEYHYYATHSRRPLRLTVLHPLVTTIHTPYSIKWQIWQMQCCQQQRSVLKKAPLHGSVRAKAFGLTDLDLMRPKRAQPGSYARVATEYKDKPGRSSPGAPQAEVRRMSTNILNTSI